MGSISNLQAVLLFFGTVIAAVLSWFGVRSMRTAPLQESVNNALRLLMAELQNLHAQDIARISELENELLQAQGKNRNLEQKLSSVIEMARRAGVLILEDKRDG